MGTEVTIYKQILPSQCVRLANLGYRSLINVRPDNETAEQPSSAQLAQAADAANLHYRHCPVLGNQHLGQHHIQQFATYYQHLPKPMLIFCGSGARAKLLYQSATIQGLLQPTDKSQS